MADIQKLENIINARLDEIEHDKKFPVVSQLLKTKSGRKRVFERVKKMILFDGYDDIEACINSIENVD